LNRDLNHPFGSHGYAREELRAEIASMIVGSELGIGYDPGQHAAYAASRVSILKDQPLEISRAAADAEKIQSYLFTLRQHRTLPDPISEYNASVDGPEARSKLEKENPALVAARDAAITQQKRERLQRESEAKQIEIAQSAHRKRVIDFVR
jgi:putative DNA primase/helicase